MPRLEPGPRDPGSGERRWTLQLPPMEATILQALPDQLERVLGDPDENRRILDRLFPTSYEDPVEQAEHRDLLGASLLDERRTMIAEVRAALGAARSGGGGLQLMLDAPGIDLWLRFVNDLRLVLATDLGVEANLGEIEISAEDPDAPKYGLLVYLGGLESLLVEAVIGEFNVDGHC